MKAISIDQGRFEPTVVRAVRRYPIMVVVIALLSASAAVGYTLMVPEVYRANATITMPQTSLSKGESSAQDLDRQVLLLQSPNVADRAARIANAALNQNVLSARDFSSEAKSVKITPPGESTSGDYGSSIVVVSFTWPSAKVAQVGSNAMLQAFDEVRATAITAQAESTVAGIEHAIRDARTKGQLRDLLKERTQTLVNQQVDLAAHPTIAWAAEPQVPINGNSKRSGAIGMVIGTVLGAGLAYARASRRRCLMDRLDPAAIYDAPLIGEIPAGRADRNLSDWQSPVAEAFKFTAGSIERILAAHGSPLVVAFASTDKGDERSSVVANVALAVAESDTPVLAVDADSTDGRLTALLLPGGPPRDGFEQVLAGQRPLTDCIQPSPLNQGLAVLGSGPAPTERTITGAAYSKAVEKIIAKAKASFDLVLIDSPALLRVADATELVEKSDAVIVVIGPDEPVRDHVVLAERLNLVESEVVGYTYRSARRRPRLARHQRDRSAARTSTSASPRSLEVHRTDEVTRRSFQGRPADVDGEDQTAATNGHEDQTAATNGHEDQTAATNGHEDQPDQPSPGRNGGAWAWPPWTTAAAHERENSRSVVS